ncbi:MAG: hypothetical protein AB1486_25820 [Planctomycetota bacterium]
MGDVPLVFLSASSDDWVLLRAGRVIVATCVVRVRGAARPLALAVLVRGDHASI